MTPYTVSHGGSTAAQQLMADGMATFTSLPTELLMLVAKELDVRSLGRFASASAECQLSAYNDLRLLRDALRLVECECVVCLEAPRTHLAVSCFHLALCEECCKSLQKSLTSCIICRADTAFRPVYEYLS